MGPRLGCSQFMPVMTLMMPQVSALPSPSANFLPTLRLNLNWKLGESTRDHTPFSWAGSQLGFSSSSKSSKPNDLGHRNV